MKFGTDFHAPLIMNCHNVGHPLTFHLAPGFTS